ncbi:hypothetical protein Tco_0801912 [Tanacetum coccineum]|uniref:Retrovirus-related Pol polyprotein from transposon TNT 1-94-like beta-barrel domain-containing protein n=1 Tax=Tanacetum coccineum TaxID=301880 RepID=A0ABQ4ZXC0_9ASTR
MADKGKKSSMEMFAPNDKAYYYSRITSITVNGENAYELKGKFLDDLHNNAFSGTNGKDEVEHIEYYLKIIDPIKLSNVDHDKLRVVVFSISLVGGARRWFDRTKESITCGDEVEVSNDESSDLEEYWSNKDETAEIFKIETNVFDYETPLCLAFNEFNYLLKVDPDLLTKDIMGFKTYEDYKYDWIYEWNENVPWVYDKPWLDNDGYCNGGNFPGAYHIRNSLHYQDLERYEALEDSELKDEALRNKAIMEGLIREYENKTHKEGHELCVIETREVPVCQIKRYKMVKYSYKDEEEYVAVKEDEFDDLTITSEEACRAYQEIFQMMDEGWMDSNLCMPVPKTDALPLGYTPYGLGDRGSEERAVQGRGDIANVPGRAPCMSTCLLSHCLGVPDKSPGMSTCPLSHCSVVPGDGGADFESEDSNPITSDQLFLELLKDENDGLVVCQVKDNKIDLLVQQYEQFSILEEESIDSGFARFNTIITSLKALHEGFSSKNYVRKFLKALHPIGEQSENDAKDKTNEETCLMAQSSNEVCLRTCLELDEWFKDSGCSKHMTGNKSLFSTYKAYDGVEESLNVTFDESPPPTKLSPLVDDDVGEEEAVRKNTKIVHTNNEEDESIEVEEIVNIKESKNHPLDQVIGNLNQRTLRS